MIREFDIDNPIKLDEGIILLDFHAPWCGPCRMTSKYLDKFNESHQDLNIVKVNADECDQVAEKFNVINLPTVMLLKDGDILWRHIGMMTDKQLEEQYNANI